MMDPIRIDEQIEVGRNEWGYSFAVGRVLDRWLGYAIGGGGIFFFAGVADGPLLGLIDRDEAIRRVGAIARDDAQGFGGVAAWSVPEDLRGDPERYRCPVCDEVCCGADHEYDDEDGWDGGRIS